MPPRRPFIPCHYAMHHVPCAVLTDKCDECTVGEVTVGDFQLAEHAVARCNSDIGSQEEFAVERAAIFVEIRNIILGRAHVLPVFQTRS